LHLERVRPTGDQHAHAHKIKDDMGVSILLTRFLISNGALPHVYPTGKHAVFHNMAALFQVRTCIANFAGGCGCCQVASPICSAPHGMIARVFACDEASGRGFA
jgi:hypothetical protein